MIADLFDTWNYEDAVLLSIDVRTAEFAPVDVETAASEAVVRLGIESPDRDGYIVPLFERDDPISTNEYVVYKPDVEHVGWHDSGFGADESVRFTDCERLDGKEIGHRLRFCLPADQPKVELLVNESTLPSDRIHPFDRLSSDEQAAFFQQLKQFVKSERDTELESNWETYEELELEQAIRRDAVSGPFVHCDGRVLPVWLFVEDEFAEVFFEVGDAVEEVDACRGGVVVGAGEDADDLIVSAEEIHGVFDEDRPGSWCRDSLRLDDDPGDHKQTVNCETPASDAPTAERTLDPSC